jgi:hypothetical protein
MEDCDPWRLSHRVWLSSQWRPCSHDQGPLPTPTVSLRTKSQISIVTSGTCWSGPLLLYLRSRSRTISRPLSLPASYYSSCLHVRCISCSKYLLTCISIPPPRCAVFISMSCRSLSVQAPASPHLQPNARAAQSRSRTNCACSTCSACSRAAGTRPQQIGARSRATRSATVLSLPCSCSSAQTQHVSAQGSRLCSLDDMYIDACDSLTHTIASGLCSYQYIVSSLVVCLSQRLQGSAPVPNVLLEPIV